MRGIPLQAFPHTTHGLSLRVSSAIELVFHEGKLIQAYGRSGGGPGMGTKKASKQGPGKAELGRAMTSCIQSPISSPDGAQVFVHCNDTG